MQIHSYENKLRDLETQLKLERDEHLAEADSLNAQIRSLKKTIEEQMEEYRDLMDVKIKLDTEIAAYRKLLEAEEIRWDLRSECASCTSNVILVVSCATEIDLQIVHFWNDVLYNCS